MGSTSNVLHGKFAPVSIERAGIANASAVTEAELKRVGLTKLRQLLLDAQLSGHPFIIVSPDMTPISTIALKRWIVEEEYESACRLSDRLAIALATMLGALLTGLAVFTTMFLLPL